RRSYPERRTFYLFYTTEQSGVKGLAQGPNSGGLLLLGIEPGSFWYQPNTLTTKPPLPQADHLSARSSVIRHLCIFFSLHILSTFISLFPEALQIITE
ncbi:MAG: hypothetical protein ACRC4N_02415, partial [Gammaproteobacteria bacterium]